MRGTLNAKTFSVNTLNKSTAGTVLNASVVVVASHVCPPSSVVASLLTRNFDFGGIHCSQTHCLKIHLVTAQPGQKV